MMTESEKNARRAASRLVQQAIDSARPDISSLNPATDDYKLLLMNSLTWLGVEYKDIDFKKETIKYAQDKGLDYKTLLDIPEYKFNLVGKFILILNDYGILSEEHINKLNNRLSALIEEGSQALNVKKPVVKESNTRFLNGIDYTIDLIISRKTKEVIAEYIVGLELKASEIPTFVNSIKDAIMESIDEDSGSESSIYKQSIFSVIKNLLNVIQSNIKIEKELAKPSKDVAAKRNKKQASKANNKKVDLKYNLVSLPPEHIIGSEVVLLFNTDNRRVNFYRAADGKKLSVKGTYIENFDDANSYSKVIRDPEKMLTALRNATSVARLEVLLDKTIKGIKHTLSGKINNHCIILKKF